MNKAELDPEVVEIVRNMTLFEDDFMSAVFSNHETAELLLQIILGRKDLEVIETKTQYTMKNIYGRSVRLDIFAKDSNGKLYDVEVQQADSGAEPHRARFNSSLMDMHSIGAGDEHTDLPDTYVIFITRHDYFKKNRPLYIIERTIDGAEPFNDGSHIIYVNGQNRDDTELGKLMRDFSEKDPDKFHFKLIGDEVSYYKFNEKGVGSMCKAFEELSDKRSEARVREAAEKAAREKATQNAKAMIANGKLSYEEIAEITSLTLEEVKELASKHSA